MTRATLLLLLAALGLAATMPLRPAAGLTAGRTPPSASTRPPDAFAFSRSAPEEGAFPRPAAASDPSELSPVLTSGLVVGRS